MISLYVLAINNSFCRYEKSVKQSINESPIRDESPTLRIQINLHESCEIESWEKGEF